METKARILSSALIIIAYYVTMYHNSVLGARLYTVANLLAMPYMIKTKCWDVVILLSFLTLIGLPKVFS